MKAISIRNNDGDIYENELKNRTRQDLIELIVKYELAYGGKVVVCEPTEIKVVTPVMHCIDTTIVTGTEEEMAGLYAICQIHSIGRNGYKATDTFVSDLAKSYSQGRRVPSVVAQMAAAMGIGNMSARSATVMALDFCKENGRRLMDSKLDLKALCYLVDLKYFDKESEESIMSLVD